MNSKPKILVSSLQGNKTERPAFWFMRQAGRYLPEYRELRSRHKNFLEFCYTPKAAAEATLQPIKRFGMDGAIIFSDILVIPHALGQQVHFEEGRGPVLSSIRDGNELAKLNPEKISEFLAPVYEALKITKAALPSETALIGFAGAPWTIACYMIEGGSSKEFTYIKNISENQPDFFDTLIDILTDAVIMHVKNQIRAGAEVIQVFDSWAGILDDVSYKKWCITPTKKIVSAIKKEFPYVPVIGFPRQSGVRYLDYAKGTGVDAVSFDATVPLEWAKNTLQPATVIQGCLSNELLANDKNAMMAEARQIVSMFKDKPFVFNLGHGILPHTPVENMQALCEYLKNTILT